MTVRIVIINWNGWEDTVACLESCKRLTYPDVHVTVVDNASSDGSVEEIRKAHPDIEVLPACANLGFSGGNNLGIRMALEAGDEHVWLLNNDTEVDPDALSALVAAMDADPKLGIAGSKIYYYDRPDTIWYAGGKVLPNGRTTHLGVEELDEGQFDRQGPVDYASGSSLLARCEAIRSAGLMSEDYFLYWEEVDWCARIRHEGWGCDYVPASKVWHKVGGSLSDDSARAIRMQYDYRNGLYYFWRNDRRAMLRALYYDIYDVAHHHRHRNFENRDAMLAGIRAFLRREKGRIRVPGEAPPRGVNLFGFVTANFGLAFAARNTFWMLRNRDVPCCAIELDPGAGRAGKNNEIALPLRSTANSYSVNVFHVNPPEIVALLARGGTYALEDRLNVCVPFWELPKVPSSWLPVLRAMDVILAPSRFIEKAMNDALPDARVIHYPQAASLPDGVAADRERFGLPTDAVVFLVAFDMHSDIERKNPWAAIAAFEHAFGHEAERVPAGDGPRPLLAVKISNADATPEVAARTAELERRTATDASILLLTGDTDYRGVLSLYASADVVVSLHRSEGLGLVPMEAMLLGKPVIATAWSGNMDFTSEDNSCLVSYELVPVIGSSQVAYSPKLIGEGQVWADANVDHAAQWMRRLTEDEGLRERLGARAAADAAEFCRRFDESAWVEPVLEMADAGIDPDRPAARALRELSTRSRRRQERGLWVQRLKRGVKRLLGRT